METHSIWAILKGFSKKLLSYFLQGLLYIVPVVVIIVVVYNLMLFLGELGETYFPFLTGFSLLVVIVLITALGFAGTSIVFRPVVRYINRLLDRAPLIKTVYYAISDLLSAFVGKKRKFNQPVLVQMRTDDTVEQLGFIVQDDLSQLGITDNRVAVYLPHSFAISGVLVVVPVERVTPLDAKAADVMKFIVSGAASDVEKEALEEKDKPSDTEAES